MIPGVTFQPGAMGGEQPNGQRRDQGVQEAIKVLSLRLPKVVGAQALAPQPLLTSPGSDGNPRVDSIIENILKRMFPTAANASAPAPMIPSGGGDSAPPLGYAPPMGYQQPARRAPDVDRYEPVTRSPQTPRIQPGAETPREPLLETPIPQQPSAPMPSDHVMTWPERYEI